MRPAPCGRKCSAGSRSVDAVEAACLVPCPLIGRLVRFTLLRGHLRQPIPTERLPQTLSGSAVAALGAVGRRRSSHDLTVPRGRLTADNHPPVRRDRARVRAVWQIDGSPVRPRDVYPVQSGCGSRSSKPLSPRTSDWRVGFPSASAANCWYLCASQLGLSHPEQARTFVGWRRRGRPSPVRSPVPIVCWPIRGSPRPPTGSAGAASGSDHGPAGPGTAGRNSHQTRCRRAYWPRCRGMRRACALCADRVEQSGGEGGVRGATEVRRDLLFLCVHNAGRSQMALGFFQHLATDHAVAWSGGSEPGTEINPSPSPRWLNGASTSPASSPNPGPTRWSAPPMSWSPWAAATPARS